MGISRNVTLQPNSQGLGNQQGQDCGEDRRWIALALATGSSHKRRRRTGEQTCNGQIRSAVRVNRQVVLALPKPTHGFLSRLRDILGRNVAQHIEAAPV